MSYKTLSDFDFQGKTVFVRADLNVPAKDGVITDMTRIDRFVPTLKEIAEKGGRVVVASHFGRPKGEKKYDEDRTLEIFLEVFFIFCVTYCSESLHPLP